jgi:hypothetical protein
MASHYQSVRVFACMLGVALFSAMFARSARAESGDELTCYVMTMGPGDEIFEKFGHNTILIADRNTHENVVYNWGMFDFGANHFYTNFLLGRLDYWAEGAPFNETFDWYSRGLNRSMWIQELNLSAAQKVKLRDLCRSWDHKFYRYNYYTDNCSTKVRDVLDEVVDGQIEAQLKDKATGATFRWHTRRLTQDNVAWYLLLDTVLGPATDHPISQWDECFLPVKLSGYLVGVKIKDATGNLVPLTKDPKLIYDSKRPAEAAGPPTWWPWLFLAGALYGGLIVWLGKLAAKWKIARISFAIFTSFYVLLLGLCSLAGLWMWFGSAHWAAWRNENLFEYSPIALPLVVLIPMMLFKRGRGKQVTWRLAAAVAVSTLVGFVLSPLLPQIIADPMALVLPINLALAYAVWKYTKVIVER